MSAENERIPEAGAENAQERELSIEEAFERIRDLLDTMEKDGVTLEESFASYEKGMELIRYCNSRIDEVEKKVQIMNADGSTDDFD